MIFHKVDEPSFTFSYLKPSFIKPDFLEEMVAADIPSSSASCDEVRRNCCCDASSNCFCGISTSFGADGCCAAVSAATRAERASGEAAATGLMSSIGAGVIAEVITSDGAIQNITPGTLGWNDESTPTTDAYLKVVNKSGSTQAITVTLHFVALEA